MAKEKKYTSTEIDKMGYVIPIKQGLNFSGGVRFYMGKKNTVEERVEDIAVKLKGETSFRIAKSISFEYLRDTSNENTEYTIYYNSKNKKTIKASEIEKLLTKEDNFDAKKIWENLKDLNKSF